MDVLFLEELTFTVSDMHYYRAAVAPSREEMLRALMVNVGLELIDYDSFTAQPLALPRDPAERARAQSLRVRIEVYSAAFRERTERAAAYR